MSFLKHASITIVLLALFAVAAGVTLTRNGLSARSEPPAIEAAVARRIRALSMPSDASRKVNPFASDQSAWLDGGRIFQEHCSVCHGDDGSGRSEIGKNLYPKAPDMRQRATQDLSDGAIYFVIMNGVRYTGMPAWAEEQGPEDTWRLVSFIRRMPRLTPADLQRISSDSSPEGSPGEPAPGGARR